MVAIQTAHQIHFVGRQLEIENVKVFGNVVFVLGIHAREETLILRVILVFWRRLLDFQVLAVVGDISVFVLAAHYVSRKIRPVEKRIVAILFAVEVTQEAEQPEEAAPEQPAEPSEEEKLKEELKAEKDKYLRLCAEYDNYRKRTSAEKLQIYDDATAMAIKEILPLADSVTQALLQIDLGDRDSHLIQLMKDKLVEHKQYIAEYGEDLPEIRNWKWTPAK